MNEIIPSGPQQGPLGEPRRACSYCGCLLDPNFYFCTRCATPYKDSHSVLSPEVPMHLSGETLVRLKAPHVRTLFFTYLGVVLGAGVLSVILAGADRPDVSLLLGEAAMLITTVIFSVLHWRTLSVQLRQLGFLHWEAWVGLVSLAPMLWINFTYHGWLMEQLGMKESPLQELKNSPLGPEGMILLICVLPAVLEEVAFRGLVQHWLHVALTPWKAIAVAAFLFAVLHFSVASFLYLFALGVILGWTKWKTGSLYPAMVIHFLHNFVALQFPFG